MLVFLFGFLVGLSLNHNSNPEFNSDENSISVVNSLRGGGDSDSSQSSNSNAAFMRPTPEDTINRREILRKHFPDWEERMDYQKKQEKIYQSGLARIAEAKRVGVKFKLTKQEQDAFDYFNGQNFYNYYQSLETPPNIYDTRWSFLLKVDKNKNMRENFLKSYNQIKSEN
jgi:hypothetical protein